MPTTNHLTQSRGPHWAPWKWNKTCSEYLRLPRVCIFLGHRVAPSVPHSGGRCADPILSKQRLSSALPSASKTRPHSTLFQLVMAEGTPSERWVLWPAHQALVVRGAGEVDLVPRPDGTLLLQGRCLQSQDQANEDQQPSLEYPNLGSHRKTWWQRWGLTVSKGSSRQGSRVHPP